MLPLFSPVSHQRLPWLQEQTLALESSSFLGCSPILDRHNGNQTLYGSTYVNKKRLFV